MSIQLNNKLTIDCTGWVAAMGFDPELLSLTSDLLSCDVMERDPGRLENLLAKLPTSSDFSFVRELYESFSVPYFDEYGVLPGEDCLEPSSSDELSDATSKIFWPSFSPFCMSCTLMTSGVSLKKSRKDKKLTTELGEIAAVHNIVHIILGIVLYSYILYNIVSLYCLELYVLSWFVLP